MKEKTNQEVYEKMIEAFNLVLKEIHNVKTDTFAIKDKTDPTHFNVLDIYGFINSLHKKVDGIGYRLASLEEQIEKLER